MTSLRVCFIGDSIVNGTGDSAMLGWTGRVCAAAADAGHDITHYDLGVRGDTSTLIRGRWRAEASPRLPDAFNSALVISFGINDCVHLDGVRRVRPDVSLANARAILSEAKALRPALFIGPTPIEARREVPQYYPGIRLELDGRDVAALNRELLEAAAEVGVPALDVHVRLAANPVWARGIAAGDGVHPAAEGYAQIARVIEAWPAWRALLD